MLKSFERKGIKMLKSGGGSVPTTNTNLKKEAIFISE